MSSYYADEDERDRRRRVEAELFLANRRRGSGESSYHPVPQPPPIYPARRVRRASTLPVRFEDERIPERGVRYDAPRPSRRYEPGEGLPPQAPPRRRETIDSLASSDSDTERGERRRKSVVEVLEERVPEAVEAGGTPARATSRVEELRSRSLSPPIRSRDQGGKTRIPARPVTKGAIIESGYAVEGRVSTSSVLCASLHNIFRAMCLFPKKLFSAKLSRNSFNWAGKIWIVRLICFTLRRTHHSMEEIIDFYPRSRYYYREKKITLSISFSVILSIAFSIAFSGACEPTGQRSERTIIQPSQQTAILR